MTSRTLARIHLAAVEAFGDTLPVRALLARYPAPVPIPAGCAPYEVAPRRALPVVPARSYAATVAALRGAP